MNYEQIQYDESAHSRGTYWGERVKDSIRRLEFFINGRILDVGCGDGLGLETLKGMGFECSGIDISPVKVEIAKSHGLDARVGYMEDLPFKDKEFDTVICFHTLEHSNNISKAVKELERVGKRLIIIVPIEDHTQNPAHFSPIVNEDYLKTLLSGSVIYERSMFRSEQEYLVVEDLI